MLDPRAQVVRAGGARAREHDAAQSRAQGQGAVIGQQDGSALGSLSRRLQVRGRGSSDLGTGVHIGVVEEPERHLEDEDPAYGVIDAGHQIRIVRVQQGGSVRARDGVIEVGAHLDVESGEQ